MKKTEAIATSTKIIIMMPSNPRAPAPAQGIQALKGDGRTHRTQAPCQWSRDVQKHMKGSTARQRRWVAPPSKEEEQPSANK